MGSFDLERGGYQCFNHLRVSTDPCQSCINSEDNRCCPTYSPINVGSLISSGVIILPAERKYEIEL